MWIEKGEENFFDQLYNFFIYFFKKKEKSLYLCCMNARNMTA